MKEISIWKNILLALLTSVIMYSCSDSNNIVTPPPSEPLIIDSNFFDWKIQTAYGSLASYYQFYVADTNKIFIAGNIGGIYFDNGTVKHINYHYAFPYFKAICVNGTSENNVYFGGFRGETIYGGAQLIHWNGNSLTNIEFPVDTTSTIGNIEVISENDMWMSTNRNIIYRYFNSVIYSYKLDSGFVNGRVYQDFNGDLLASYYKPLSGCPSACDYLYHLYRFNNNNWNVVEKDTLHYGTSELETDIRKINSGVIRVGLSGIYYRSGDSWQKFINTGGIIKRYDGIAGENRNNVLISGFDEMMGFCTYYFNGSKIYRQPQNTYPYPAIHYAQYKYGRYYMTTYDYELFVTYLYIATFKKPNSENLNSKKNENKNINNSNNTRFE